jgi:hypothetical protein
VQPKHPYDMKLNTLLFYWYDAGSDVLNKWFPIDTSEYILSSKSSWIARGLIK